MSGGMGGGAADSVGSHRHRVEVLAAFSAEILG